MREQGPRILLTWHIPGSVGGERDSATKEIQKERPEEAAEEKLPGIGVGH
jgi:hypothetical protein